MSMMHSAAKKAVDRSEGRGVNNLVDDYGRPTAQIVELCDPTPGEKR